MLLQYVYIGIGSNQDADRQLQAALAAIGHLVSVVSVAPLYQSAASGGDDDTPDYFNSAILAATELSMTGLKTHLRAIEDAQHRVRYDEEGRKSLSVTLDCDILLVCQPVDKPVSVHEDVLKYAHALVPLADLSPDLHLPGQDSSLSVLAEPMRQHLQKIDWNPHLSG